MINHTNKKNIGKLAITVSLLVWIIDRMTQTISTLLGKIICGNDYMQTTDGKIGDFSCGFNIDMHLAYSLFTLFLFGVLLYFSSMKKTVQIEENIENKL